VGSGDWTELGDGERKYGICGDSVGVGMGGETIGCVIDLNLLLLWRTSLRDPDEKKRRE
jgi:hypothetical protein